MNHRTVFLPVLVSACLFLFFPTSASAMLHPTQARFLQRDPVGYPDGPSLYSYVASDPVGSVDPEGLRKLKPYERCLLYLLFPEKTLEAAQVEGGPLPAEHQNLLQRIVVEKAHAKNTAITIGSTMYFPEGQLDTASQPGMAWLAHEMRHTEQYAAFSNSKEDYFSAYLKYHWAGGYKKNPFEVDARVFGGCMNNLMDLRPELRTALGSVNEEQRNGSVCCLTDDNWTAYKGIVTKCLAEAKRADTTFIITELEHKPGALPVFQTTASYQFNFYLKEEYTEPVGGKVFARKGALESLGGR